MSDVTPSRQFCSINAKSLGADPLGTAPMHDEFIMVEFDLPWARDIVDSPGFPDGVAAAVSEAKAQGRRVQVHGFAPDGRHSQPGKRRVMYFRTAAEQPAADEYGVVEYVVPAGDVGPLVRFLLFGNGDGDRFDTERTEREDVRDLFVCTHGARDACCGKFGAALHLELDALVQKTDEDSTGKVRVWRVNHLGGHRFAPTLLELPRARYWGALDSQALQQLLHDPARLEPLRPYYRGWSALHSAQEQIAEGEAWRRIGPRWLAYDKTIRTVISDDCTGDGEPDLAESRNQGVDIVIEWADPATDERGRIELAVEVGHVLTLRESCGKEDVESKQYIVSRYEEVENER